jgi:predicted metal-dependent hydrolase
MPESSNSTWSNVRSELLSDEDFPAPILLQPMRNAKRMRLRFDERNGTLKLTYPRGMAKRTALNWAAGQREWVEKQLRGVLPAEPFVPGAIIPIAGEEVELCWSEHAGRTPKLAPGKLVCGGPSEGFPNRIERFLKRYALELLSRETAEFAAAAGVTPASVTVGDAGTRWGSCSSARRLRYSWRLIFAPFEARRFVVAHEVAHLVHLNHGAEFKALERKLYGGDAAAARALLRRVGPRLRRLGRRP